jgi:hypothetical protein
VNVTGSHNKRNFRGWAEWQKADIGGFAGCLLETMAICALADEDQADAVFFKEFHRAEKRIPGTVESEIPGVDRNELKTAAKFLRDGVRLRGERFRQVRAIANHRNAIGRDALLQNSFAHIIAENNHEYGVAQRASMQTLPAASPSIRWNNFAAEGHVGVEITNVVYECASR